MVEGREGASQRTCVSDSLPGTKGRGLTVGGRAGLGG